MSLKFNVGDRVRIVNRDPFYPEFYLAESVVVGACPKHDNCYELDIRNDIGETMKCPGRFLKLIYDGNEPVVWSDCAWKPKKVSA